MKYHVTKNGEVKPCQATTRACKYSFIHEDTPEKARETYEKVMQTMAIESITKKENLPEIFAKAIREHPSVRDVQSYGYSGSHMYGLSLPTSDIDLSIIIEGKSNDKQYINDEYDLRVYPVFHYVRRLFDTSLPEIDLLYSHTLQYSDTKYQDFLQNFRYSPYEYHDKAISFTLSTLRRMKDKELTNKRELKSIKSCYRTLILGNRAIDQGLDFDVRFSPEERDLFFNSLKEINFQVIKKDLRDEELFNFLNDRAFVFKSLK